MLDVSQLEYPWSMKKKLLMSSKVIIVIYSLIYEQQLTHLFPLFLDLVQAILSYLPLCTQGLKTELSNFGICVQKKNVFLFLKVKRLKNIGVYFKLIRFR